MESRMDYAVSWISFNKAKGTQLVLILLTALFNFYVSVHLVRATRNKQAKFGKHIDHWLLSWWCIPHGLAAKLPEHSRTAHRQPRSERNRRHWQVPFPWKGLVYLQRYWNYTPNWPLAYVASTLLEHQQNKTNSLPRQMHLSRETMVRWKPYWINRWNSKFGSFVRAKPCQKQHWDDWNRFRWTSRTSRIKYFSEPHWQFQRSSKFESPTKSCDLHLFRPTLRWKSNLQLVQLPDLCAFPPASPDTPGHHDCLWGKQNICRHNLHEEAYVL